MHMMGQSCKAVIELIEAMTYVPSSVASDTN